MSSPDKQFRNAMGKFATGVTIITTCDDDGRPLGMTANSFASLSLDPQLVLWNLGDQSDCFDSFRNSNHFAIHVLHRDQEALSGHFATKSTDKFKDLRWRAGECGSPILDEFVVCLECRKEGEYPGGDHLILVGRVVKFEDRGDLEPLVFHSGKYRSLL